MLNPGNNYALIKQLLLNRLIIVDSIKLLYMISVICGTNRKNNKSGIIAKYIYNRLLETQEETVHYLSMEDLPEQIDIHKIYDGESMPESIKQIQDQQLIPYNRWIIVSPEYNGSFPGILKFFLDMISMRKYKETFAGRHSLLIGVAAGRAGNLRGMEHLTGFLNYLKIHVFPEKLPISSISKVIDEDGNIDTGTRETIDGLLDRFLKG